MPPPSLSLSLSLPSNIVPNEVLMKRHQKTTLESPNRLSLLYTLTGSNPSLKPALYMAHQDVVPINSAADWTHPPFSGYYDPDTDFLWGRGSSDCKNVLIGLLSVLEDLLAQDWTPQRTVIFSFGFDEESHGFLGAGSLSRFLEERYGSDGDGVEFILDEGGMGLQALGGEGENGNGGGTVYALPGVGEKGALDLVISLNVTGGHSSIPPPHTGIGIVSEIIYNLERTDLFTPLLGDDHPLRKVLECQLAHSPDHVEPWLSQALASDDQVSAAEDVGESRGPAVKHVLRTSQAVDMIGGGVKSNALPEKVSAVVNYRVGLHETPEEVIERAVGIIAPIAEEYGLGFSYPGSTEEEKGEVNHIDIRPLSEPLQPAPVSPTSLEDLVWRRFAGVTRGVFEDVFNKTVVVVGDVMTGNTDTRFYWNLSRNIYRWSPTFQGDALNIHTVDERMKMEGHLQGMMVYYGLSSLPISGLGWLTL